MECSIEINTRINKENLLTYLLLIYITYIDNGKFFFVL